MPVSFNNIPAGWKLPLYWVEVDPSMAGGPSIRQPALIVGTMLASGSAPANVPVPVGSLADARALAGLGSMLDGMFEVFFNANYAHEVYMLPIAEAGAGQKATGTITVASVPTQAGTIYPYIGGRRVSVGIAASDTQAIIAANIVTAINADPSMHAVASLASTGATAVTLTCKWKGVEGNDIDMRVNYGGSLAGEAMPAGLTLTFSNSGKLSGGTGSPDLTTAIANLGDEAYEYVAEAFTDSTSLVAFETEYGFGDNGRWGWLREEYGHVFAAKRGDYATLLTYGPNNNSGVLSIMAFEQESPSPAWLWAAAYTAKAGRALLNDPARPLQTLELTGCLLPPKHQRFTKGQLNALAGVGLATQTGNANNVPMILRESTTYQKNLYSQGDTAYELVTTLATLAALFRRQRAAITSKFPRHKLANDGTRFGPGQAIVTPKIIKAELVAQYREDEFLGLVENATAFKANLIVERDSTDPNRVNVLYPPDLVNQLRVFAVLAQFRLQYSTTPDLPIT